MDNNTNADLDMIEALLATMQQNPGQLYDDVDDDDDDDYEDDDEDDDDDDGYYGEHNIHTLLNPYVSGGDGGDIGGGEGQMQMHNVQTMNFLQGLLNMNNSGMAEIEAAIGGSMGGALGGMGGQLDGGSGGFLPAMQSLLPNMGSEMAGALAGAFAGGMNTLMDYGHDPNHEDYDDDDDDDDDDDVISDEEDDEDDDDDDDPHDKHGIDPSSLILGGVGGLMAAGLLANAGGLVTSNSQPGRNYPGRDNFHLQSPSLMGTPTSSGLPMLPPSQNASLPNHSSASPPLGFCVPTSMPIAPLAVTAAPILSPAQPVVSPISIAATSLATMSGGTVSKADPLAALVAGIGGAAIGAGIIAPIVSSLLGNSGGTTVVNKLNSSSGSSTTVIGNNVSFNSSSRTITDTNVIDGTQTPLVFSKLNTPSPIPVSFSTGNPASPTPTSINRPPLKTQQPSKAQQHLEPQQTKLEIKDAKHTKEDSEDDKASLDSAGSSEESGLGKSDTESAGKSDTESAGKKTPSPLPEGSSTNPQAGSCASIPDLASATESMRDSDTDNHSEVHNVTANLSDLDNDVLDHNKSIPMNPYSVGPLPVFIGHPPFGWGSLRGLDTAKEALKNLFVARSFPAVFEGTEGSCKGILLFGPPRSGKTELARALAKEATNGALFVGINSRFLLTHNPFDAVKLVRYMFEHARQEKPAVILFDEIEALCYPPVNESAANHAKEEILAQVRGLTTVSPVYPPRQDPSNMNEGILVLGTTNQPWLLEERLRKVFAYNIHIKLPAEKTRHELFRACLQSIPHYITEEELICLVSKSEGYPAEDIAFVTRQAHRVSLQSGVGPGHSLTFDDLASIMTHYNCRYTSDLKQKYSSYISAATHRAEDLEDNSKEKKDKPKGVKKFSHKIAKSLAAAVLAVID